MSHCCKNTLSLLMYFLGQYGFVPKFAACLFPFFKRFFYSVSFLLCASTRLTFSCVLSVGAFNDKILTDLDDHKLFYNKYNNNDDNNNNNNNNKNSNNSNNNNNNYNMNNNDNDNNKRNVLGILQRKPRDIIVSMHVFVRNASW